MATGGSSADPFAQPNLGGQPGEGDRASYQQFISATPRANYVYVPELGLYVDPNIPKDLAPKFVTMKTGGGRSAVVPYTGKRPNDFLAMMGQPIEANGGGTIAGSGYQPVGPDQGLDAFLGAPTQRPNEPVTAGVPMGPGPSFVRMPGEDDRQFRSRIGQSLMRSALQTDPLIRSFALRLLGGD